MKDLKLSKKESKSETQPTAIEQPQYPYGTRLDFDSDLVKKLGIEDLEAEDEVRIEAIGSVTRKTVNEDQGGKRIEITIQLKKMEVNSGGNNEETKEFIKSRNTRR